MAVHVCSLPETLRQAVNSGQRPMAALLASLAAFFHHYAAPGGFNGVLQFAADGSSSECRSMLEQIFQPATEGCNELPSFVVGEGMGALLLWGEGVGTLELGVIEHIIPR